MPIRFDQRREITASSLFECLESCGTAPVCMIGEQLYENADGEFDC